MFGFGKKKAESKEEKERSPRELEVDRVVEEFLIRGIAVDNVRVFSSRGVEFIAHLPEIKPFSTSLTAYEGRLYLEMYPKDVLIK